MSAIDNEIAYIYLLSDPDTGAVRYVGQTCYPDYRLSQHILEAKETPVGEWLGGLRGADKQPIMSVVEKVAYDKRLEIERRWIQRKLDEGCSLLNSVVVKGNGRLPPRAKRGGGYLGAYIPKGLKTLVEENARKNQRNVSKELIRVLHVVYQQEGVLKGTTETPPVIQTARKQPKVAHEVRSAEAYEIGLLNDRVGRLEATLSLFRNQLEALSAPQPEPVFHSAITDAVQRHDKRSQSRRKIQAAA